MTKGNYQKNKASSQQANASSATTAEVTKSKANWVEVLVVSIILTTLGWLAVTVFNMNGTLSRVEAQGDATKSDLASIKGVLPEIGKTIAQFEVKSPIEAAFISSKPFSDKNGWLVKTINLIDTKQEKVLTYTVPLKNENDSEKTLLLSGIIYSQADRPVSFLKLENYSNVIGMNYSLSASIDVNNSFLISDLNASKYSLSLNSYFGQPKVSSLNVSVDNWVKLNENLSKLPITLNIK